MRRRTAAPVAALALALAACSGGGAPAAEREPTSTPVPTAAAEVEPGLARFYGQALRWRPCDGDFQCATLQVPLDYAEPDREAIGVAVLRAAATGADRLGSLLVNPGGPGGSGVDYARAARAIVSPQVLERYDVVGFDPRGVGGSTPVDCLDDAGLDAFVAADGTPDDETEVRRLAAHARTFAAGCRDRSGDLLAHVGTENVARDLDVLRAVLGDETLTYLGKSYGTVIGATYAGLFPAKVGRLVLDGAMDPALTGHQVGLGQAAGFEQALDAYLDDCLAGEQCPLGATKAEALQTLQHLLAVIDAGPLPTADADRPLTEALATLGIALPFYLEPEQGYPALSEALAAALAGNGAPLLRLADVYLDRGRDGYNGNQSEAFYAVSCTDRREARSVAEVRAAVPQFEAASPRFGPYLAWSGLPCAYWPVVPAGEAAPVSAPGAAPIVVVGTAGDPATPYEWAVSLAGQLESGVLVSYEGAVHTAYGKGSDCVDDAVDRYLVEGKVPEDGLTCRE